MGLVVVYLTQGAMKRGELRARSTPGFAFCSSPQHRGILKKTKVQSAILNSARRKSPSPPASFLCGRSFFSFGHTKKKGTVSLFWEKKVDDGNADPGAVMARRPPLFIAPCPAGEVAGGGRYRGGRPHLKATRSVAAPPLRTTASARRWTQDRARS